jgi:anaerobic C4-dicarboxylate transporter
MKEFRALVVVKIRKNQNHKVEFSELQTSGLQSLNTVLGLSWVVEIIVKWILKAE